MVLGNEQMTASSPSPFTVNRHARLSQLKNVQKGPRIRLGNGGIKLLGDYSVTRYKLRVITLWSDVSADDILGSQTLKFQSS